MRPLFILVLLAALSLAPALGQEPARTGSISGTVTIDGKPAPGVAVLVAIEKSYDDIKVVSRVSTDKEGRFVFTDLGPGDYTVLPNAPAYVINGQKRTWKRGMSVTVAEGETVEALALVLERGGVITGRVYDANGKPVIGEPVQVIPVDEGGKRLSSDDWSGSDATDDRGVYRAYGLIPGRYIVSAGTPSDGSRRGFYSARKTYPETFYPGVMDEGRATPVEISPGGEASGIDIGFGRLSQTYAASGRVIDENGAPVAKVNCGVGSISGGRLSGGFGFGGPTNDSGEFRFTGLIPGSYAAIVMPDSKNTRTGAPVNFEIVDRDVSGIVVTMRKGVTVSGAVVLEGPAASDPATTLQSVTVMLTRPPTGSDQSLEGVFGGKSVRAEPDGTFTIRGVAPGRYQLGIWSFGRSNGLSVARIERGGVPVSSDIEVTADADLPGLALVLVSGSGTIRGRVTVAGGTLPYDRMSIEYHRADVTTQHQRASIDDRGQFLIERLAAGEYIVSAAGFTGDGPANWMIHKGKEKRVTVADGAASDVSLALDLENDPTEKP